MELFNLIQPESAEIWIGGLNKRIRCKPQPHCKPQPNAIVVAESGRGMNFYTRNQKEKEIMLHEKDV